MRSFVLKVRRPAPPSELGIMLATGLRKHPDGREGTYDDNHTEADNVLAWMQKILS